MMTIFEKVVDLQMDFIDMENPFLSERDRDRERVGKRRREWEREG